MNESLIDAQNRGALEAAYGIAFGGKPGIVIVVRGGIGQTFDVAGIVGKDMKAEELRSAIIGAAIAVGRISEQMGKMGTVLEPEK